MSLYNNTHKNIKKTKKRVIKINKNFRISKVDALCNFVEKPLYFLLINFLNQIFYNFMFSSIPVKMLTYIHKCVKEDWVCDEKIRNNLIHNAVKIYSILILKNIFYAHVIFFNKA